MANSPSPSAIQGTLDGLNPKYAIEGTGNGIIANGGASLDGADYIRPELSYCFDMFDLVDDCIGGAKAVKLKGEVYLPHPDPRDKDTSRYEAYKLRAVFFNATRRTRDGLIGQVFMRPPTVKVPSICGQLEKNCDGSGLSLEQLAKRGVEHTLDHGRCGLLADFPDMEGRTVSRAELLSGTIQPVLKLYNARDVRNWRTISVNGKIKLSLVVLAELYDDEDNGFEAKQKVQFRVLRLTNGRYTVQIYKENAQSQIYMPTDGKGKPIEEIPFTFIGAKSNNADIDYPPMYDLATVNIAHYRNSADYEESVFIVGQPTPWASGLTQQWVTDVMKGELRIGSRAVIPLPENGACGLLQAEANTLAKEALDHKERQMVALGAKLVEQQQVQRTATESNHDKASETSVLSSVASNVAQAIKFGLEWCAIFTGEVGQNDDARSEVVDFSLNTEFDLTKLDSQTLTAIIKTWQSEALTDEEMRDALHRAGYASDTIEDWKSERDDKMASAIDQLANETIAQQPPADPNNSAAN